MWWALETETKYSHLLFLPFERGANEYLESSEERKEIMSHIRSFCLISLLSVMRKKSNNLLVVNRYNSQGSSFQRAQLIPECTYKRVLCEYDCKKAPGMHSWTVTTFKIINCLHLQCPSNLLAHHRSIAFFYSTAENLLTSMLTQRCRV